MQLSPEINESILAADYFTIDELKGGVQSLFDSFRTVGNTVPVSSNKSSIILNEPMSQNNFHARASYIIDQYLKRYIQVTNKKCIIIKNSIVSSYGKYEVPMISVLNDNCIRGPEILYKAGFLDLDYYTTLKSQFITQQQSTLLNSDKIISVSSEIANDYSKLLKIPIDVIPNGVDTDKFIPADYNQKEKIRKEYNIPKDKKVGIYVGDFHPVKGFHIISKLVKEYKDILWIIVTKMPIGKTISKNIICFNGIDIAQIIDLYRLSDFFILPSAYESFNISSIEAMSCDIPVIVQKAGTFASKRGVTDFGIVVDDWSYESYKEALDSYLNNDYIFEPRAHVEDYQYDMWTWRRSWINAINEII